MQHIPPSPSPPTVQERCQRQSDAVRCDACLLLPRPFRPAARRWCPSKAAVAEAEKLAREAELTQRALLPSSDTRASAETPRSADGARGGDGGCSESEAGDRGGHGWF